MKTTRTFKGSWFLLAVAVVIIVGEVIAWGLVNTYGLRANPLVIGFLCAGLVAAFASVLYEDADVD
jgi:hypothetical protein